MRLFKDIGFSRAEQSFKWFELLAVSVAGCAIGFIICGCIAVWSRPFPEFIQVCLDKSVDIGIAATVSVFFVYRYESRKRLKENALQYVRDSRMLFEEATQLSDNSQQRNYLYVQALDYIDDAQKLLCQLKLRSCVKALGTLRQAISSSFVIQSFVMSADKLDGFENERYSYIKMYNRIIARIIGK